MTPERDYFTAPKARVSDPVTSHKAVPTKRRRTSQAVFLLRSFNLAAELGLDGMTDEEAAYTAATEGRVHIGSEYATRCSELRDEGLIEPTGKERPGQAGKLRIESRITDSGRDYLKAVLA